MPLLIGVAGPSGSGKTYSSLRLASGIQRVTGKRIGVIDSEAKRALAYAGMFKFEHLDFKPPFGPLDYMGAIEHMVKAGVGIIIIDSMSHEHSGEGGVLDQIDSFLDAKCGNDEMCRNKNNMLANKEPKFQRKQLNNRMVQLGADVTFILCYRASDKVKPIPGQGIKHIGWQPETTSPLIYEMTARFLLLPACDGKPHLNPQETAEKMLVKQPEQFRGWFQEGVQLTEDLGEKMALWAKGAPPEIPVDLETPGLAAANLGVEELKTWWTSVPAGKAKTAFADRLKQLKEIAANVVPDPALTRAPSDVAAIETLLLDLNLTETYAINLAEQQGARVRSTTTLSTLTPEAAKLLLEELQRIKERSTEK